MGEYRPEKYEKMIEKSLVKKEPDFFEVTDSLVAFRRSQAEKKTVFVRRVAYGSPNTPEEEREYQIDGEGPVGTIQEFIDAGYRPVIEEALK